MTERPASIQANFSRLPMSVKQSLGFTVASVVDGSFNQANASGYLYDGVAFNFFGDSVEIRAPSWTMFLSFDCTSGGDVSYVYHLNSCDTEE